MNNNRTNDNKLTKQRLTWFREHRKTEKVLVWHTVRAPAKYRDVIGRLRRGCRWPVTVAAL